MLTDIPRFRTAFGDALVRLTRLTGEFPTRRRARGLGRDPRAAAWITLALRLNRRVVHCFNLLSAGARPAAFSTGADVRRLIRTHRPPRWETPGAQVLGSRSVQKLRRKPHAAAR